MTQNRQSWTYIPGILGPGDFDLGRLPLRAPGARWDEMLERDTTAAGEASLRRPDCIKFLDTLEGDP